MTSLACQLIDAKTGSNSETKIEGEVMIITVVQINYKKVENETSIAKHIDIKQNQTIQTRTKMKTRFH